MAIEETQLKARITKLESEVATNKQLLTLLDNMSNSQAEMREKLWSVSSELSKIHSLIAPSLANGNVGIFEKINEIYEKIENLEKWEAEVKVLQQSEKERVANKQTLWGIAAAGFTAFITFLEFYFHKGK